jgi:transketolase
MALAERIMNARFGAELVDHHSYVFASDGDLMEGISHESCAIAGHLQLGKLIVLYDDNGTTIDGNTDLAFSENTMARYEAYGWHVQRADGHDHRAIEEAIEAARESDKPSIIAFKTRIGYCAPNKEGTAGAHDGPYGEEEVAAVRKNLGWHHEPFDIPEECLAQWRQAGDQSRSLYQQWQERLDACDEETSKAFYNAIAGHVSGDIGPLINELKAEFAAEQEDLATRHASGRILDKLVRAVPELIGGSADLSESNKTRVKGIEITTPANDYSGQYIHYGVREHGMAAIMNGMALHGGIIPYGGTFMTFSDYCRPAIRLAALMQIRTIFVMTHDSIGVGEDGPTHQPVEQIAALRAIPGLHVFRPCDGVEAAECWQLALNNVTGPSVLALTRQKVRHNRDPETVGGNRCEKGGYIIRREHNEDSPQAVIFASGSEVGIAMKAADELQEKDMDVRVVALPCLELFLEQDAAYRQSVSGPDSALKIGVEAGVRQGWDAIIGPEGLFIGMDSFGESGPGADVFAHFGITAEAVAETALQNLKS